MSLARDVCPTVPNEVTCLGREKSLKDIRRARDAARKRKKRQSLSQEEKDEKNRKRRLQREANKDEINARERLRHQANKDDINERRRLQREANKDEINERKRIRYEANKDEINANRREKYETMPIEQKRVIQQKSLENYHSRRRQFILKPSLRRYAVDVSDSEDDCHTSSSDDSFVSCISSASLGYDNLEGDEWCNCGECAEARNAEDSEVEFDMSNLQYCQPCSDGHGGMLIGEDDAATGDGGVDDHSHYSADEYSYGASHGDGSEDLDSDAMDGLIDDDVEADDALLGEEISLSSDCEVNVVQDEGEHEMRCENCLRKQIEGASSKYQLEFHAVSSGDITGQQTLCFLKGTRSAATEVQYLVCSQCSSYLRKIPLPPNPTPEDRKINQKKKDARKSWRYSWPSFFRDVLFGSQRTDGQKFREIFGAETLWRFVPQSCRPYWRDCADPDDGTMPYAHFDTDSEPESFFQDRTAEIDSFWADINSYDLGRWLNAFSSKRKQPISLPNVLCPWGCSEFCFRAETFNVAMFIQLHLSRAQLNFPDSTWYKRMYLVESSRLDYIRHDEEYDTILLNKRWRIRPSIWIDSSGALMVLVCRNHHGTKKMKRLYMHAPRKPDDNKLSPEIADQLSHAVVKPATLKSTRASTYCTSFRMVRQVASWCGIDSCSIGAKGRFDCNMGRTLMARTEALSVSGRADIRDLMNKNVSEHIMHEGYAEDLRWIAQTMYPEERIRRFTHGSTFVPLDDALDLQMEATDDSRIIAMVYDDKDHPQQGKLMSIDRTWLPIINYVQTEDRRGFGYPTKAIDKYQCYQDGRPSMMLWSLSSVLIGCKELWRSIDQREGYFSEKGWDAYFLVHLSFKYMKHCDMPPAKGKTPFVTSSVSNTDKLLKKIEPLMTPAMQSCNELDGDNAEDFFKFSYSYWCKLFPRHVYPRVAVVEKGGRENGLPSVHVETTDVLIMVDTSGEAPTQQVDDIVCIREGKYEARVINWIGADRDTRRCGDFDACRFVRHGNGYDKWRKQLRTAQGKCIMTECLTGEPYSDLANPKLLSREAFACVIVYVKVGCVGVGTEERKIDFHKSLGGQGHVYCSCCNYPLLSTGRKMADRRVCMMSAQCKRKESHVCSRPDCKTRICKSCLGKCSEKTITYIDPPNGEDTEEGDVAEIVNNASSANRDDNSHSDEEEEDEVPLRDSVLARIIEDEAAANADVFDETQEETAPYNDGTNVEDEHSEYDEEDAVDNSSVSTPPKHHYEGPQDDFFLEDYKTDDHAAEDEVFFDAEMFQPRNGDIYTGRADDDLDLMEPLPTTNAGTLEVNVVPHDNLSRVPCHVLLNQAGICCSRYNHRITGTSAQQNFIQRMVSTISGSSFPLIYPHAMLFPRHFYAQAKRSAGAILGSLPLCCISSAKHLFGFESNLDNSRSHLTSAGSSTSTDQHLCFFNYDIQCNSAMSNIDSRLVNRHGFVVDEMSANGISLRDNKKSELSEGVDSHRAGLELAGAGKWVNFDIFATQTCNQREHPGISHLHAWKESEEWTEMIEGYDSMIDVERKEYIRAMENAYGTILARCWFEVRKLWLEYITFSASSVLKRVMHAFWRDEYQEHMGNLPHIHGLIALYKEDMENKEFREMIFDLQKCSVLDLCTNEDFQSLIDKGIVVEEDFWPLLERAKILSHKCTPRCQRRIGPGDGPENFVCRKIDTVFASEDCGEHEFQPLKYVFSEEFKRLMEEMDLYEPPQIGQLEGTFFHKLLNPTRHVGKVMPGARDNMSPVCLDWFAALKSMMNFQILTSTNGVARYVVKYVVKLDQGNRCTVYADANSGATLKVEKQFLHNTKITSSKINEDKALERSRKRDLPQGRAISFVEALQHQLGYPEVMQTLKYVHICTKAFEHRGTTRVSLDKKGKLNRPDRDDEEDEGEDVHSAIPRVEFLRDQKHFPADRRMTMNQLLLYKGNCVKVSAYDKVTLFGLRPMELLRLFDSVEDYYRWFEVEDAMASTEEIDSLLVLDVESCPWFDCIGRRVRIRHRAFPEALKYLRSLKEEDLSTYSAELRCHMMALIEADSKDEKFVFDDDDEKDLPIPIFSSVTPDHPVAFVLHVMLMCGRYETELDLRACRTLRDSLALAKLIDPDNETPEESSNRMVKLVMDEVFPRQPLTMRKLEDYILTTKNLFDSIIIHDEIPNYELPSCILTELLDSKEEELCKFWLDTKRDHLDSIYDVLRKMKTLPEKEKVMKCDRDHPMIWDKDYLVAFEKSDEQEVPSHTEQLLCVSIAVRLLSKYKQHFGEAVKTFTKGQIIHGVPGAGKSHVISYISLIAISMGLRLMTTALMGVRANAFGGIHLHSLLCLSTKTSLNPYRLAELAVDKLHQKRNILLLHCLLTVDVLVIDECGMLSAEQLTVLDIVLRKLRRVNTPFGGVLIFGTMDHAQFSAIDGLPFLLSTHMLTDFTLVGLKESVRASGDINLRKIQTIARMNPDILKGDEKKYFDEFSRLCKSTLTFEKDWGAIDYTVKRLYAKCKQAQDASNEYVNSLKREFDTSTPKVPSEVFESEDHCCLAKTKKMETVVTDPEILAEMNRKLREPPQLLFYKGALFESTVNKRAKDKEKSYSQSQLLYMKDIPSKDTLKAKNAIKMYAAKPGWGEEKAPKGDATHEELVRLGWRPVTVSCKTHSRKMTVRGYQCTRKQYSLRHIGSSTITRQTGKTITGKCAIEVSKDCAPWDKPGAVVALSRATKGKDIIIVAEDQEYAIEALWKAITTGNQWTNHVENILHRLSVNPSKRPEDVKTLDYMKAYPFRTCDIMLPTDRTGYVYILMSVRDTSRTYVGQTIDLKRRLRQHNSGSGAKGTANSLFRPYCIAGYICRMNNQTTYDRIQMEIAWKDYNTQTLRRGDKSVWSRIANGQRIVDDYNRGLQQEDWLLFVQTIKRNVVEAKKGDSSAGSRRRRSGAQKRR